MTGQAVRRWSIFDLELSGPRQGNPYLDVEIGARFTSVAGTLDVSGFYDGEGTYRVRLSPDVLGAWSFVTHSNVAELDGQRGEFTCLAPDPDEHGPVDVDAVHHFRHRDGTRYIPVGTTCYAWIHQEPARQAQTLATLAKGPFNKLRMCVFPKDYIYNENEPPLHPFELGDDGRIRPDRPSYAYFAHLDRQVAELGRLGIQADVILFHPYDRWGYSEMSETDDLRYLRYVTARLGAHPNVWWSLANEYDFLLDRKPVERWEAFFAELARGDVHRRLTSIHNGEKLYDHARSGISHVSIQHPDVRRTLEWRAQWAKPVVNDEPEYEGDVPNPWGNISAQELVHRFWLTAVCGGYAGHGETYLDDEDVLWWAKGGLLHGESPPRIAFLRSIMEASPGPWEPLTDRWEWTRVGACDAGSTERIIYFGPHQPRLWARGFPEGPGEHSVELIDPWAMSIEPLELREPPHHRYTPNETDRPQPRFGVALPGRPNLALRIRTAT